METVLETNMSANNAEDPIQSCVPQALLSFTPSAPLVIFGSSGDWATISPNIILAFCKGEECSGANGSFVVLLLQSGESPLSPSAVSHSDSASSTQSLSHGGAPELLVGLSYNATTGRLSVEMIKGSHFRNLAVNRVPGKFMPVPPALVFPEAGRRLCLPSSQFSNFYNKNDLGVT